MNHKHAKTLKTIFTDPISGNIEWRKIESLFIAIGCELIEGNGSRVTFVFEHHKISFHRPHPNNEALRYRVSAAREFLQIIGVTP
jgi:hypothetical protein